MSNPSGAGCIGGCELLDVGAEIQMQTLGRSSMCSRPWSPLRPPPSLLEEDQHAFPLCYAGAGVFSSLSVKLVSAEHTLNQLQKIQLLCTQEGKSVLQFKGGLKNTNNSGAGSEVQCVACFLTMH